LFPINFGQAVNRLLQQLRRGVIVRVEFLVNLGALEPEVGAEVDDDAASLHQRHGKLGGHPMRQREEDDLSLLRK